MKHKVSLIMDDKDPGRFSFTQDSLANIVTGSGQGKHEESKWKNSYINFDYYQLESAMRTSWCARKIITIVPEDMSFRWRKFTGTAKPEQQQDITDRQKKLKVVKLFRSAQESARLYGTGFLILNIDGTGEPHTPLDIDNVKAGAFRSIVMTDRRHLHFSGVVTTDPFDPNYNKPEFYTVSGSSIKIHHTRILRFEGEELPLFQFRLNQYCSDSVLVSMEDPVKQFEKTAAAAAALVDESSVDVLKLDGLFDALGDEDSEAGLRHHVRNIKRNKSNYNMTVIDGNDDYVTTGAQNLQGLDSLMLRYLQNIAAAVDVPITRFLQTSPSGLQATGSSEERKYADVINTEQENKWRENLELVDELTAKDLGIEYNDHDLDFEWKSIIHLEESDDLENERKWLNNRSQAIELGILDEAIVAKDYYQQGYSQNFTLEHVRAVEKAVKAVENGYDEHDSRFEASISAKIENPEPDVDNESGGPSTSTSTKVEGTQSRPKGNTKRDESGADSSTPKTKNTKNVARDEALESYTEDVATLTE